ncbi:DUF2125 domain-containing protein [Roseovarius sp. SYSU LYC5161]|uniref:DUF2125 domain-containing protein n=1 Tax=Roseovarius halophilus (ex Wu et al. 2025) TaxID=3376060 RepID=UPI003999F7B4
MTFDRTFALPVAALGVFISGSAAVAEVTPAQVWGDWKAYMAGFGYAVTSEEAMQGDTLSVTDIRLVMQAPEEGDRATLSVAEMRFSDNGDGTVSVAIPDGVPMGVVLDSEGEQVEMALDYSTDAFEMTVSGDPGAMRYDYAADAMTLGLAELIVEGEPVDIGQAEMTLEALSGSTEMMVDGLRRSVQNVRTGTVRYRIDMADPEGEGRLRAQGGAESTNFAGTSSLPRDLDTRDMPAMLAAGFAVDGRFSYVGGASEYMFEEDGQSLQGRNASESGRFSVAMSADGLTYDVAADDLQIEAMSSDLPFPVGLQLDETRFGLQMPVAQSEETQDFALSLKLGDFTMSDSIWSLFDPQGKLPHDPATFLVDVAGKARLLVDVMDAEGLEDVEDGATMPGDLESLTLNDLVLRAVGAELSGTGAFTFDNSDTETFEGLPAPDGKVDLKLVGGNGVLDRLIDMGLLPEEQATSMRMMMGMFAVPGEGEDTLVSTIEVQPDGKITANGQRLR